jgi:uncharacterized membrane protein
VILLSSILVAYFLVLEASRYRHYDMWQQRVYMLERAFYAPMLDPDNPPSDPAWRARLAADLREPHYHVSLLQAMGWRLQRNYLWLFLANAVIWLVKIDLHPTPSISLAEFVGRAAVGPIPGLVVLTFGVLFNGTAFAIALLGARRPGSPDITRC